MGRVNNSISLFVAFVSSVDEIRHDLLMSDASHAVLIALKYPTVS